MKNILELTGVRISNFLSIKDELTIPINRYNDSFTSILVGKNDCGKSNLLKALSCLNENGKKLSYTQLCHRDFKTNKEKYIDLYFEFKVLNNSEIRKLLKTQKYLPESLIDSLEITKITKNVYGKYESTNWGTLYTIEIIDNKKIFKNFKAISLDDEIDSIIATDDLLPENKVISENEIMDDIESLIADKYKEVINNVIPKVISWQSNDKYLIFNDNPNLQLTTFINDINSLIPLKNMFLISGKNEDEIKIAIEEALKDSDTRSELESELSTKTTEYIAKVWKNQNIPILVRIEENGKCTIQIEDAQSRRFDMKYKSDGFKQFVSLILSLSAENSTKKLSNTLVLIDEPETHLYPESIDYMRKELLEIGKNNYVFVSTHSPFMVDKDTPNRHWKVEKNGIETSITQINDSVSMWDNKVLESAFGLNVFRELLPQKILVVEGNDDKVIFEYILKSLNYNEPYAIKSAGGCSHVPALASMFSGEKIYPYFILDDDVDGRNAKTAVIKRKEYKQRTFTLKDLVTIPFEKATLEDLYPQDIVKSFFEEKQEKTFTISNAAPILSQIINQDTTLKGSDDSKKEKRNQLKYELAEKIIITIESKELETKAPLLIELGKKIIEKLDEKETNE